MISQYAALSLSLLFFLLSCSKATSDNCFWRASDTINAEGDGWFACNNTQIIEGGAQLCCIAGSSCGEDSICHSPTNGYYVGGCTDGSYGDPVCRSSCTDDAETWIQWNTTASMWQCCGDYGCTGIPTTQEMFTAVAPSQWTAVLSSQTSTASSTSAMASTAATTVSTTVTSNISSASASSGPSGASSGLSIGAAAGIGVAAAIVALAMFAALLMWWLTKRRQACKVRFDKGWQHGEPQSGEGEYYPQGYAQPPQEMAVSGTPAAPLELGNDERQELPGSAVPYEVQDGKKR